MRHVVLRLGVALLTFVIGVSCAISYRAVTLHHINVLLAREAVLRDDLFQMRRLIDQYAVDRGSLPKSLDDLVRAGYLRELPEDAFTGQKDWVVLAQSAAETESNRIRRVKGHVLISTYLPSIRVRFDKRLKYVGSQKFILYERAQVEQHFFVAADKQGRIKRLYMVQFEGYLPNINATYDYPVTKTVDLGGQTYLVNAESMPNVSAVL